MKVFISWSRSIKKLNNLVWKKIDEYINKSSIFLIWDAIWVDELVQRYLVKKWYFNVEIYTAEIKPRILESEKFKVINFYIENKKWRQKQKIKDIKMTELADVLLVIWDWESRWSYENILRWLKLWKKVEVFFNGKFLENVFYEQIKEIFYENHKFSISEYIKEFKIKLTTKEIRKLLEDYYILKWDKILIKEWVVIEKNRYWKSVFRFDKKILDEVCKSKLYQYNQNSFLGM